ncbi:hypothetical protein COCCADRAFT_35891 [Bipolaris zeicola 26-R-13]|uniref:Uncharacterized protein n=1 Tax=Cochliobolus carbonum (strain 26-R-13) TaxID=930089 RepID=W6YSE2_COCC2|nr:uncharacterized protein COCCADRAFT_35891 [Bipolaris zeicola 26-R-13]EUC34431.1 hypothetical protein COCCADRAFT_35891 [Bipolaris zeicola 26-R-13]
MTVPLLDGGIAVRANDPGAVPKILEKLLMFRKSSITEGNDGRLDMLALARGLVVALETPRETMIKHNWVQPGCHTAITACYNAGVFKVLAEKDRPTKVDEIAAELGIPRQTLARMMKHIAAMGYIKETGTDEYAPTNFSKALDIPIIGDGYPCLAGGAHPSCSKFPEYLKGSNYELTSDIESGPYQFAFNTKMSMFEYMIAHPPLGQQFNHHMSGYRQGRPSWMDRDFYPVKERLVKGMDASKDAVMLVDVGGGHGHDIEEFRLKHPDASGRLVLQDLPPVIDSIENLHHDVERMKYDFYTEQPIKAARAYYLHSVLHDWPDDVCKIILDQVTGAMKQGYSKLLINEIIIPDQGADSEATGLDMMMMTLFSSKERTMEEWKRLLESPGLDLKIVKVWSVKHSQESLIECELA